MTFRDFRDSLSAVVGQSIKWDPKDSLSWECENGVLVWLKYSEANDSMILGARLVAPVENPGSSRALHDTLFRANAYLSDVVHLTSALTPEGHACLLARLPMKGIKGTAALEELDRLAVTAENLLQAPKTTSPPQTSPKADPRPFGDFLRG